LTRTRNWLGLGIDSDSELTRTRNWLGLGIDSDSELTRTRNWLGLGIDLVNGFTLLYTCQIFLGSRTPVHANKFSLSKKAGIISFGTRLLGKEKLSIFCRPHEQIKLVEEKLLVCKGLNFSELSLFIKVWDLSFASYWAGASCKVTMVGHLHTVRCLQVSRAMR
jgi:hypothetical protein